MTTMEDTDEVAAGLAAAGRLATEAVELEVAAEAKRQERNKAMYTLRNTHHVSVSTICAAVGLDRSSVHEIVRGPATRHWRRKTLES
jgi:hypothetical protein